MTGILVRACKALSVAPQNRRHILDAGALDLLVDALCSEQEQLSLQAIQASERLLTAIVSLLQMGRNAWTMH